MLEEATPQLLYSSDNHGYALKRLYEQLEVANGTGQPSPHHTNPSLAGRRHATIE